MHYFIFAYSESEEDFILTEDASETKCVVTKQSTTNSYQFQEKYEAKLWRCVKLCFMRQSSKIKETPGQVLLGTFNKISLSIFFGFAKLSLSKNKSFAGQKTLINLNALFCLTLKNLNALFCWYIVFRRRSAKKAAKVRKGSSSQCRCCFYEGAVIEIDVCFCIF